MNHFLRTAAGLKTSARLFSSTTAADIIQGPSLLRTSASVQHRPRPSMLQLPGLRSLPFWTQLTATDGTGTTTRVAYSDPQVQSAVNVLEGNWETIWKEYKKGAPTIPSDYQTDTEHSLHRGTWDWHSFMRKGKMEDSNHFAKHFPETTKILQQLQSSKQLFEGTPFGYAFFSTLHGKSQIQPHTAPMNLRLRIHLALSVPEHEQDGPSSDEGAPRPACGIRVGATTREWTAGKAMVLDDCFEHQVWNDTNDTRVILLVDIWHPDIGISERLEIVNMFAAAQAKGWL